MPTSARATIRHGNVVLHVAPEDVEHILGAVYSASAAAHNSDVVLLAGVAGQVLGAAQAALPGLRLRSLRDVSSCMAHAQGEVQRLGECTKCMGRLALGRGDQRDFGPREKSAMPDLCGACVCRADSTTLRWMDKETVSDQK